MLDSPKNCSHSFSINVANVCNTYPSQYCSMDTTHKYVYVQIRIYVFVHIHIARVLKRLKKCGC